MKLQKYAGFPATVITAVLVLSTTGFSSDRATAGKKLMYNAPGDTVVQLRQDGAVRGAAADMPQLFVLSPTHIGLTIQPKPTLFWYRSGGGETPCEVTIVRDDRIDPVLIARVDAAMAVGLHKIHLTKYDVALEKDITYRWYTALVPDDENRSQDVVASGVIKRVDPPSAVARELVANDIEELVYIMAEEGIWYDALEFIDKLGRDAAGKQQHRSLLAELLDQGDLPEVAAYVRTLE